MVCRLRSHPIVNHVSPIIDENEVFGDKAINPITITTPAFHIFQMFCFIDTLLEMLYHEICMHRTAKSHGLTEMQYT
jgi:hypothetical protein